MDLACHLKELKKMGKISNAGQWSVSGEQTRWALQLSQPTFRWSPCEKTESCQLGKAKVMRVLWAESWKKESCTERKKPPESHKKSPSRVFSWLLISIHMWGNYLRLGKEPLEKSGEYNGKESEKKNKYMCMFKKQKRAEGWATW